jgi:hypothetical protein
MELAGLEPATSWVRLRRKPLSCFAILRRLAQSRRSRAAGFATGCHPSPWLLDQNLTTRSAGPVTRLKKPLLYPLSYGARPGG